MKKRRSLSIKGQLMLMSILPVLVIGVALLSISAVKLKNGMMDQALEGLMAAAELYKTEISTTSRDLTTNELEDEYKKASGFDFTRFEGDTRAATSVVKSDGTRPIGTKASDEVIDAVINHGQTFVSEKTDVAGSEYCVAYTPLKDDSGKVVGMAFAGKPTAAMNSIIKSSITTIVISGIVIIIVTIVLVFFIANRLVSAVGAVNSVISYLSNGEFEKTETMTDRGDELGEMIRSSNTLIDSLTEVVNDVKNAAGTVDKQAKELSDTTTQIHETTDNVSEAVKEMALGVSEQASEIEKVTQNVSNLSDAIHTVAENAESLASSASDMDTVSKESAEALDQLSENMNNMGQAVAEISKTMEDTNRAVKDVNEKVDGITSIAEQTNLLALNASIEAARAGEAGRGFAVVAEEIGNLATESARTADEIRNEMQDLLREANMANAKAEEMSEIGENVSRVLNETVDKINSLIDGVGATVEGVNTISALTEECDAAKTVIVDAISSLSAISEENAASTEETSASMQELNSSISILASGAAELQSVAEKLDEDLEFFKL